MDPVDQEKDWTAIQQIAAITLVIGLVYLVLHFAVVIPDWGWRLIMAATLVGVALYYELAFRRGKRKVEEEPDERPTAFHVVTTALLIVVLTFPVVLALYLFWFGVPTFK